jgi:hypothetical protein
MAKVCGDGKDITTCRKFLEGDRVSAMIDTTEGWCDVAINGDEVTHRYSAPLILFHMCICTCHRILNELSDSI